MVDTIENTGMWYIGNVKWNEEYIKITIGSGKYGTQGDPT